MAFRFLGRFFGNVASNSAGYAIGGATTNAVAPLTQDLANRIWSLHPDVPLSPADLANAYQQGFIDQDRLHAESAMSGFNSNRADIMFELAGEPPGPQELGAMYLRGIIDRKTYDQGIAEGHTKTKYTQNLFDLLTFVLPADAAAQMVVQNIITEDAGVKIAAKQGVDKDTFTNMVHVRGRPPGPAEAGRALLRGIIDRGTFNQVIAESDIKTKYTDMLYQLMQFVPSGPEAAQMVVQNILTDSEGISVAAQNGIDQKTFENMVHVRGRPISPTEAITLANRNELTRKEFDQVIAESDVKTKYTDKLWLLREHIPSLYEIRQLVQNGAVSDEQATTWILDLGYSQEAAAGIVSAAHNAKNKTEKDLTKSEIMRLYQDKIIDRNAATSMITQLGYDDKETGFLLDLADFQRVSKNVEAAINRIRTLYINHRFGENSVVNHMDALGVPGPQRDQLIKLWDEERAANVKVLTEAQIVKAVKKGTITTAEGIQRMQEIGYGNRDAAILFASQDISVPIPST